MTVHVYVGPTLPSKEVLERLPEAELHPPVAHGDLLRLRCSAGDTVLVIDGDFYHRLPIRNQEIMLLLQEGVRVVGAAGMGALRAAELHPYGMVGIGAVYDLYRTGTVDGDDEVAVLHGGEDKGYRPASESLINMRCVLRSAMDAGVISAAESVRLCRFAESLPVADRSWPAMQAWVASDPGAEDLLPRVQRLISEKGKGAQFADALRALDFVAAGESDAPDTSTEPLERLPVTPFLKAWMDQHRTRSIDGELVDDVSVLRFLQLYDPAFPQRWALYAMGVIVDGSPRTYPISLTARRELADACLVRAAERLGGVRLEESALRYWLAGSESALDERERLLRIIVRSYRAPGGVPIHGCPPLFTRPAGLWLKASHAVAECRAENRRVSELSPRYSVQRIKRERVLGHFARIWGVEDTPDAVLAAARDRAITSLGQLHTYGRELMLLFLGWDAGEVERFLEAS